MADGGPVVNEMVLRVQACLNLIVVLKGQASKTNCGDLIKKKLDLYRK